MTGDGDLADVCAHVSAGLEARRPRGCVGTSAATQRWRRLSGSYADGRFTGISTQSGQATAARYVMGAGLRYHAATGLVPDLADRLHADTRGPSAAAARGVPGPRSAWFDTAGLAARLDGLNEAAHGHDPRITGVFVTCQVREDDLALARDGAVVTDHRTLANYVVRCVASDGQRIGSGVAITGTGGALDALDLMAAGRDAARRAVVALDARPAPMGTFPVVIGGGRGMVMLHEACCHPLEADQVLHDSIYAGRLGERIASPLVTLWDDATAPGAAGSYGYDDEGRAAQATPLIEHGVLRHYLTDYESAHRLGVPQTGNGRCATLLDPPLPRMSNTRLEGGTTDVRDIIADTGRGIYAEHLGGGEVVESTGAFVFRITSGYLIENGRITAPIQETTVAGKGADVLLGIDAVGNDVTVSAATCAKFDQFLPVGVIGPTVRVRSLLVGGTDV